MNEPRLVNSEQNRDALSSLLWRYFSLGRKFLLQSDLQHELAGLQRERQFGDAALKPLQQFVEFLQEGVFQTPWAYFSLRPRIAAKKYLRIHKDRLLPETISSADFLGFKEQQVSGDLPGDVLEVDFAPFNRGFPRLKAAKSIGQGMVFLNRKLASDMFSKPQPGAGRMLDYLNMHAIEGQQLMFSKPVKDVAQAVAALQEALALLETLAGDTPWASFRDRLEQLGFAPGWGNTAARVADTMNLLMDILEAPSPAALESMLARIPMISRILIVTPHGYFGQANVLGLPDTGGQVVYILDQVRSLEKEMHQRLQVQGVDVLPRILIGTRLIPEAGRTSCNQRLEKINDCDHTWILRVPFREKSGEIVPQWISRFDIWPYLEDFSHDLQQEALAEFGGNPDLIIGNYSDGNLVASLLSQRLQVTQCNIAHALEKTKYLHSDVYWQENEDKYHFSCQYTADLIGMNSADFIISSTYEEIAGTRHSEGQYESYRAFTMPGLYRVLNGVDLYDPKFNIVSPGADSEVYFPYSAKEKRLRELWPEIESLLHGEAMASARGVLADKSKPLIFTMARLDRIKNLTGLVEWFGRCSALRERANLVVVGGRIDAGSSTDDEERELIARMHALMDEHALDGQMRWLGMRLDKHLAGELYRYIADRQGVFVQPALFESFGLTIIEAMASGLPVFATRYGGPLEIIQHQRSGFHIDPNEGDKAAHMVNEFLDRCDANPKVWEQLSDGALARIATKYTWKRYAEKIMTLSRIYGFWKFASGLERQETARYLQMFYQLQFRPLAGHLMAGRNQHQKGCP